MRRCLMTMTIERATWKGDQIEYDNEHFTRYLGLHWAEFGGMHLGVGTLTADI